MSSRLSVDTRRSRSERAGELGMSLIEMVIAVAMLMVVMVGVYRALRTANTSATALSEMSQQEADSRRAVDIMVTDLRMAWTGSTALSRIDGGGATAFNACTVTFYAPTREATAKLRRIQYTVSGSDLMRSETISTNTAAPWTWPASWNPAVRVLGGLHNVPAPSSAGCSAAYPVFTYYDKTDTLLALPGSATDAVAVKRIELDLTIDRIVGKFPDPDVFATSVELRSQ
jgi:Tfp pilus assembly protein PilW